MAINADQLLNRPSELHRRYSGRLAMQKAQQEKMVGGASVNIVLTKKSIKNVDTIKTNVVKIESILKGTLALDKKQLDDKKIDVSKKRKEKIETKLETKPNAESGKISMPAAPRMGILDFVKNFIGNILLGYFAIRLIKHLPKIMPIVKFLGNAADFIIDVGGKLLNGLVTFVQKGQEAHDKTRGFIKNLGGENFAKGFDKFIGAIDTALFLTTVLAGSMVVEALTGDGGGPGGRQPTRPTRPTRPTVTQSGGTPRPMGGRPRITGDVSGGGKFKLPSGGSIRSGGIAALVMLIPDIINSGMLVSQGRAKDGIRTFLSAIAGVGAGLAAMSGVTAGAAALGITGVGIPAAIALAIAGYAASSAASFLAYEGTNALLKKMGLVDNDPKTGKPYAYRSGGITRGGKSQRGARRTISKGKYKRVLAPQKPSKTELKTETFTKDKILKESTEELDKTKYFGPILAISSKIMNKEEPTQRDYQNVGLGINMLISQGVQQQQLKGGLVAAFASGGLVDPDVLSAIETGGDISNWVAKTFQAEVESNAQKTLRMIREKKEERGKQPSSTTPSPDGFEVGPAGTSGDKLTMARNLMRDLGLTADQAAGIVGNMAAESGVENARVQGSRPGEKGVLKVDGKTGYGIVQWTSQGRQQALADYAKSRGADLSKPLSMDIEYQFFLKEFKGKYGHVLSQIKQARDVKTASTIFMQQYEVPAGYKTEAKIMERYNMSKPIYDKLALGQGKATEGAGTYIGAPTNIGKGSAVQYVTGDVNYKGDGQQFYYDLAGHGLPGNYHDHIAFATIADKEIAKKKLRAAGIEIGSEYKGRERSPGYHGKNLAFDVPGGQWGGSGAIGQKEFAGSRKVRQVLGIKAYFRGGRVSIPTFATLAEKGPEFVFDADTTAGLDRLAPQLLERLNIASTKPQLASILQSYAPYDAMSPQTIIIPSPSTPEEDGYDSRMSGGGVAFMPIGGGDADPFSTLYQGG